MEGKKTDHADDNQRKDTENSMVVKQDLKLKIPRPPNAFMLYANEHRKIMAQQYPADSNKEISKKLGKTWKQLDLKKKAVYFEKANTISEEHKRKYPGN
ncbi:unnamed protein product [Acanthoscelides obtectus]|uniref:Sex-determining region Y protein n=1 Tax=Acanthoscelides obtectus TaxID=200917 RepID=A0A9P0JIW1_ACAOB|nr:unnamed protein product [Acanthoscelides obtectus]CAK1639769.1 Sex-determining region Y protein [Acanthoscelides obtectus]